jgi:branched-subunit amino acid transport protein
MKKIICLVVVILMIAAVAYAAKKVAITPKNVASLKGTWTGVLSFATIGAAGGITSPCTLEVFNDTPPLKAKLTISNVPTEVAQQFGIPPGQKIGENDDGTITADGAVMWTGADKNFLMATLMDNKKLSLWYYFRGMRGDATVSKK